MSYTRSKTKTRRRRTVSKKRAVLIETALRLFKRYGIKRVTVSEICDEAQVSKVTFYKHFSDKVDITKLVIELLSDRIVARIDEIAAMAAPFSRKVELLVEERVRMASEWSPHLIEELYHAEPPIAQLFAERARRSREHYMDFIRRAQQSGDVRPDIHPDVLFAVLDKIYELGRDDALVARAGGFERLTRDVNNIFFYGILGHR